MTEFQARALLNIYLYPEEARINSLALEAMTKKGLVEKRPLCTAVCTPKGERIALRQLIYLCQERGILIKDKANLKRYAERVDK